MKILSIDGGGSKTDILLWEDGATHLERLGAGINHHIHGGDAKKRVQEILDRYKADIVVLGLAGLDTPRDWIYWREAMGERVGEDIILVHDVDMALYAGEGRGVGIVVISGTGSNVYARNGDRWVKMGDWGSPYGDDYSAHELGRIVLRRFLRMYDGRSPRTALYDYLVDRLGPSPIDTIYGLDIPGVARIGVDTCIEMPHEVIDALDGIAYGLARTAQLAAGRLGLLDARIHYTGGLFRCPLYAKLFRKHIRYRGLILGRYIGHPVVGGVAIALEKAGRPVDPQFIEELDKRLDSDEQG